MNLSLDACTLARTKRDPDNEWTAQSFAALLGAQRLRNSYDVRLNWAIAEYSDGDGRTISGIYRSHYPESVKAALRNEARGISAAVDRALVCWRRAGRRMYSLRPYAQLARTLDDGRTSYY